MSSSLTFGTNFLSPTLVFVGPFSVVSPLAQHSFFLRLPYAYSGPHGCIYPLSLNNENTQASPVPSYLLLHVVPAISDVLDTDSILFVVVTDQHGYRDYTRRDINLGVWLKLFLYLEGYSRDGIKMIDKVFQTRL